MKMQPEKMLNTITGWKKAVIIFGELKLPVFLTELCMLSVLGDRTGNIQKNGTEETAMKVL